ncbi:hypothetical protein RND71_035463 [Anisodus tanguticus]|uniref:Uncharacterized protein n=1 Tax=Anisodus tanguticus TaxID=243964 RepID=A0AAE1R7P5_9SOLA|nr:hypothetical protein RND71_035463 [Anisodus tanguticus]
MCAKRDATCNDGHRPLEDPLSISIPVSAVRLALSPQSIAKNRPESEEGILSGNEVRSFRLLSLFSSLAVGGLNQPCSGPSLLLYLAYWIGRYSLSYRLLIELVGNGREGNQQITGQLKEGNARGFSDLFCLTCYWEERAAVILRFVRQSTAYE